MIKAVIGSMFGDEGKGLFTDYLSSQFNCTVVRHNGGAQAGHTVTTSENQRHVFGSLGSGSFNHRDSFMSSFFVFNPLVFAQERQDFIKYLTPKVFVNNHCYLSTPFDMILNQLIETQRGNHSHGSCGLGFGESIQRCENKKYSTFVSMLDDEDNLRYKLKLIQKEYFNLRVAELGIKDISQYSFIFENEFIEKIISDYLMIKNDIIITNSVLPEGNIVFEGAQGLLLDQDLGYFPHVTRSNTGIKNIVELMKNANRMEHLEVVYATRCYTTRHGNGPLKNALEIKPYENIIDLTNIPNQFQGTMRFSYLDLDLLKNNIERDIALSKPSNFSYRIGISCLDQTKEVKFYENNQLKMLPSHELPLYIKDKFKVNVLGSWGPTRETIIEY